MNDTERKERREKTQQLKAKIEALLASSAPIEPEDARECMQFMYDMLEKAARNVGETQARLSLSNSLLLKLIDGAGLPKNIVAAIRLLLDEDAMVLTPEEYASHMADEALRHGTSSTVH